MGGAVFIQGPLTLTAATLHGNRVTDGLAGGSGATRGAARGAGISSSAPGAGVKNSICAGNTASGTFGPDVDGAFTSGGYKIIGSADGSTGFTAMGDQTGNNLSLLDLLLGPLANNGGPTDSKMPLEGGPARDRGRAFGLSFDQRGGLARILQRRHQGAHTCAAITSMNSINQNQTEENRHDLRGVEAKDKIRELIKKSEACFFCTALPFSESSGARPMSVLEVDDEGNLWFLSADDSYKNAEIAGDPSVHLYFQGSAHSDFLHLLGQASISRDPARIRRLWQPLFKTWFTEGENDPRITAIRVVPVEGYYWDTKHGNLVAGIKMIIGAALGKTMDDSVEGTLRV